MPENLPENSFFLMIIYAIITLSQGWQNLHRLTLSELQMVVDTCVYKYNPNQAHSINTGDE